jgi:hypothetical protein
MNIHLSVGVVPCRTELAGVHTKVSGDTFVQWSELRQAGLISSSGIRMEREPEQWLRKPSGDDGAALSSGKIKLIQSDCVSKRRKEERHGKEENSYCDRRIARYWRCCGRAFLDRNYNVVATSRSISNAGFAIVAKSRTRRWTSIVRF